MVTYSKTYIPGDRLVECDICGYGYRVSKMQKGVSPDQSGYDVCPTCFDGKHPLDTPVKLRAKSKRDKFKYKQEAVTYRGDYAPSTPWVVFDGEWDDDGVWKDTAIWRDLP